MVKKKNRKLKRIFVGLIVIIFLILIVAAFYWYDPINSNNTRLKENVVNGRLEQANIQSIEKILYSFGAGDLHKSYLGYGNPIVEVELDDEVWYLEVDKGKIITKKGDIDKEDLKIKMTKEELNNILSSLDIQKSMTDSIISGKTKAVQVAGKVELVSKGYLKLYKEISVKR
mgnify:FL=1